MDSTGHVHPTFSEMIMPSTTEGLCGYGPRNMVSPAGFEPATPGLEGLHFGVSGVFQMRCNPYISAIPGFRSIYAVAPKTLIPSLRGDAVVTDEIPTIDYQKINGPHRC